MIIANTREKMTKINNRKEQAKRAKSNRKNEAKTKPERRDLNRKHNEITLSKANIRIYKLARKSSQLLKVIMPK